ncbi:MAG: hypothetical protein ACYCUI_14030 [Vulcanimicrobiaceae bacterium]
MNATEIARNFLARQSSLGMGEYLPHTQCAELCRAVVDAEEVNRKYHELLYAVGSKYYPDETRHQTALRYIQQFESQASIGTEVMEKGNG